VNCSNFEYILIKTNRYTKTNIFTTTVNNLSSSYMNTTENARKLLQLPKQCRINDHITRFITNNKTRQTLHVLYLEVYHLLINISLTILILVKKNKHIFLT